MRLNNRLQRTALHAAAELAVMFKKHMRLLIAAIVFVMSMPCHATDTLDCVGEPYSIMIHVGHGENGEDFLADIMLYEEGHTDPVAVYSNKNIDITIFKWSGGASGNMMNISSKPDSKIPLKLKANDSDATIKVYEKEFSIKCFWER